MAGVLGLVVVVLLAPPAAAQAPEPEPAPTTVSIAATTGTSTPAAVAGQPVPGAEAGRGPQLTGRTEPPPAQRIADSLIWAWLLAVLVGGTAWWAWTGRRRVPNADDPLAAGDEPAGASPPPETPAARR
jgi:hypothetical protein